MQVRALQRQALYIHIARNGSFPRVDYNLSNQVKPKVGGPERWSDLPKVTQQPRE